MIIIGILGKKLGRREGGRREGGRGDGGEVVFEVGAAGEEEGVFLSEKLNFVDLFFCVFLLWVVVVVIVGN